MKISDATKILQESNGSHLEKIYIPSLKKFVLFHPLTTANVKTLTRINFIDNFDLSVEIMKLSLFDKLCAQEDILKNGINSHTLTEFDYLSFLIGLRQLLKNDITFTFTCKQCGKQFKKVISLDQEFDEDLQNFTPQNEIFQKLDQNTNKIWKFELTNYTMQNYLYYKFVLQQLKEKTNADINFALQNKYLKPLLYIKNIYLNDELIEDWPQLTFPAKMAFFNKISPNVTINETKTNKCLFGFIYNTFAEEKLEEKIRNMTVTCQHCNKVYRGVYKIDNFFTFQGSRKTI